MSYRLIDSNAIAIKYPEVNEMPCVYANLPDGMNGQFIDAQIERKKGKWIPCSEGLPEDGVYLVTRKDHIGRPSLVNKKRYAKNLYKVSEIAFHDKKGKGGWYDYDGERGYWEDTAVVAWMPLPEPWKGKI